MHRYWRKSVDTIRTAMEWRYISTFEREWKMSSKWCPVPSLPLLDMQSAGTLVQTRAGHVH